ncbi:MAG: TadE/TadG family type IV pilus assembly protein [Acidimicrobiia bacterium]
MGERERGASLVEFALIVPLLTLFLFGIVQFGLAYDKKQSINSAAREGARTAAIPTNTVSDVEAAVENSFQGLIDGTVTTTVMVGATTYTSGQEPCDGNAGQTVVVESHVDHELTIPFFGAPVLDLQGRGEFRCERA